MKQVCILLALACFSGIAHAQFSLTGKVTGAGNETLTGAYVMIENSYYQTVTGPSGQFAFNGMKPGRYVLTVSYIGYEPQTRTLELNTHTTLDIQLKESAVVSDAVVISAVRASQNTPTTFTTISKAEINRKNMVQDLPYLLSAEPSVVTTSDAGAGVGYTGLRIRGSDITRINVTINGIPLNDPESHGVYWVDIPDFASSVNSLQLQRGVGSSTNGAGAFGASMNIETSTFQPDAFGEISLGAGSFNTWRTSFKAGNGLINNHWYFEGRGSALGSDGYIDRAASELSSFFFQGGYYDDKTLVKALVFGGKEKTYQAWYGVDAYTMGVDRTFNWAGAIFDEQGNISYYDNQTDNYNQNHYQLHVSRRLSGLLHLNISGHYTRGSGYYEEYQQNEYFSDYGLGNLYFGRDSVLNGGAYQYFYHDTICTTDLIRRRWLDNHYYGVTWSLRLKNKNTEVMVGGAINKFDKARHYGEIIWSAYADHFPVNHEYYNNTSFKTDVNIFTKAAWSPVEKLTLYGDLQYRTITYKANGIESHLNPVAIDEKFHFLNPKAGLSFETPAGTLYASYGIAHREPIRDDYIDALEGEKPKPETLGNLETGIRKSGRGFQYAANFFLMHYQHQLVLTGAINDDGQFVRRNAGSSYRAGVEFSAGISPAKFVEITGNFSYSQNRTDYKQLNSANELVTYKNTVISFSPDIVAGAQARFFPVKNLEAAWMVKFVGKQYLDNTQQDVLALDPYLINDLRLAYLLKTGKVHAIELTFMVNNLFDEMYESNGYVYDNEPYYYPQAGVNLMGGINVKF